VINQQIWIGGPTAIGKRTLIEGVLAGDPAVRSRLAIDPGASVGLHDASHGAGLRGLAGREHDVVLVKWQGRSRRPALRMMRRRRRRGASDRAILLWRPFEVHLPDFERERYAQTGWTSAEFAAGCMSARRRTFDWFRDSVDPIIPVEVLDVSTPQLRAMSWLEVNQAP
jgi:hypothetical protein